MWIFISTRNTIPLKNFNFLNLLLTQKRRMTSIPHPLNYFLPIIILILNYLKKKKIIKFSKFFNNIIVNVMI